MSTPTVPALVTALVDDAAIFPPGNAPLPDAVDAHRRHRSAGYSAAVGPLLVRATDAAALHRLLEPGERLRVALVVRPGSDPQVLPTAVTQLHREDRAVVVGLEVPVSDPLTLRPLLDLDAPVWLEVRADALTDDLDAVAAAGARAKLRTGGLDPSEVPDDETLADFVLGCRQRSLTFKLTAGLHHGVRSDALPAGLSTMPAAAPQWHGVANVLLATARAATEHATQDAGRDAVLAALRESDPSRLREGLTALDPDEIRRTREAFASFGCCGVTDPLSDLIDVLPDLAAVPGLAGSPLEPLTDIRPTTSREPA